MAVTVDDLNDALSVQEFAETLGISVRSAWRLIHDQHVEVVRVGKRLRITQRALNDYLNRNTTKASSQKKAGK